MGLFYDQCLCAEALFMWGYYATFKQNVIKWRASKAGLCECPQCGLDGCNAAVCLFEFQAKMSPAYNSWRYAQQKDPSLSWNKHITWLCSFMGTLEQWVDDRILYFFHTTKLRQTARTGIKWQGCTLIWHGTNFPYVGIKVIFTNIWFNTMMNYQTLCLFHA